MILQPIKDRVLVQLLSEDAQVNGGIHIPASAIKPSNEAKVIAVGGDVMEEIQPGARVLIGRIAGTRINIHRRPHQILSQDHIEAVIDVD